MSEKQARRAKVKLSIDGHDATSHMSPSLVDFSYTDNISGKADEVQITLQDRDAKWNGEWKLKKGQEVTASIELEHWNSQGEKSILRCGTFKIDEVSLEGPPDIFKVKAVTSDLTSALRDTTKTRAWENQSLQGIASEIAGEHGLTLQYDGQSYQMKRQDQREEADLPFVARIAKERAMECKVHDKKLILFDSIEVEQKSSVQELKRSEGTVLSYSFSEQSSGTAYKKSEVAYTDTATGTTHKATAITTTSPESQTSKPSSTTRDFLAQFEDEEEETDEKTLQLNERVENASEAMRLAKSKLHNANKSKSTASATCVGSPNLYAGMTVNLTGFGDFSGKFLIEKATHKLGGSSGYTTAVELRKCSSAADIRTSTSGSHVLADVAPQKPAPVITAKTPENPTETWKDSFESLRIFWKLLPNINELENLLLCLPEIAEAEANRASSFEDGKGWLYLQEMFWRWFSYTPNTNEQNTEPFWVDMDWVLTFPQALLTYGNFTSSLPSMLTTPNVINRLALESLGRILCRDGYMNDKVTFFDFTTSPYEQWQAQYHTEISVPRVASTNGLMAALAGFTFKALAKGQVEPQGDNKYRVTVTGMAIYVHDAFQFAEESNPLAEELGQWSCSELAMGVGDILLNGSYHSLSNNTFRKFREKYGYGADFLVFSLPKKLANFEGVRYDYICTQDSQ